MTKSESKYFNTAVRMDEAFLELLTEKDFEYITVKEICEKACVNRSTFYLHYETMGDLLDESFEYKNRKFMSYFPVNPAEFISKINDVDLNKVSLKDFYFITPEYLIPYLNYVKENRRLFKTTISRPDTLHSNQRFETLVKVVIEPIMERYQIPSEQRRYILIFNINGIIGIIKEWLNGDCRESTDFIVEMITDLVLKPKDL